MMALCAVLTLGLATPAAAQDAQGDWQVSFTPYVWIAGINADIEVPSESNVEFDRAFSDTLSSLKFAFMGALNVEHGNLVFFVDGNYLSLASGSEDIEAPNHLDGEVETTAFESTPLVGYKVINDGGMDLELLGGGRFATLKNDIHLELPNRVIDDGRSRSAIAPVIATRLKSGIGGRWGMTLYGDVGGFTDLKSTWQLFGAVNYRLGNHWDVGAGYRHMSLKFDKETKAKLSLSGPVIGFTYRF